MTVKGFAEIAAPLQRLAMTVFIIAILGLFFVIPDLIGNPGDNKAI